MQSVTYKAISDIDFSTPKEKRKRMQDDLDNIGMEQTSSHTQEGDSSGKLRSSSHIAKVMKSVIYLGLYQN